MTQKSSQKNRLLAEQAAINKKLNIIDDCPEDTYTPGTIVLFTNDRLKWYYLKTGEDSWRNMHTNISNDLASWILDAIECGIGAFKIYVLTPQLSPIFVSA